jgi:hypothetical protein
MKSHANPTQRTSERRQAHSSAPSAAEFNELLQRLDLTDGEVLARFRRAAPMLSWPGLSGIAAA